MSDRTALGDRMKSYEYAAKSVLIPRMPLIIRVDGRAFHTYTRSFNRPWSLEIRDAMTQVGKALLQDISGAKIAYCQSDEVSVLVTDYDKLTSQPWFGKSVQKIASVSASVATAHFNLEMMNLALRDQKAAIKTLYAPAYFDARCFVLPKEEVCNYFVWRQRDAIRNSISSLAQVHFSSKKLFSKTTATLKEMLKTEKDVSWDSCETWQKRGWCVVRTQNSSEEEIPARTEVCPDWETPEFTTSRKYIEDHVFIGES
jgi:tRNA(His) guanylyltransferase